MILEEKEGEIIFIKEAKSIPEIVSLLKKSDKKYIENAMIYIYWMYSEDSIYREMLPSQRQRHICKSHLKGADPKDFETNKEVRAVIDLYEDIQCSREERLRRQVQRDMDDLLTRLGEIKFTKEVVMEVTGTTENGETVSKKIPVTIDNSKEKADALALSKTLITLSKELDQLIKANAKNKKQEQKKRLYDIIPNKIKK